MSAVEPARTAIVVSSALGGIRRQELERKAALGERPRKDYVELARLLDADIIDGEHMAEASGALSRLIAAKAHFRGGQISEIALQRRYRTVLAWGDFVGLTTALLFKLTRSARNLAVVSYNASGSLQTMLLKRLKVHTHLRAMFYQSSVQLDVAQSRHGVAPHKLHRVHHPVDETFWTPSVAPTGSVICSAGLECRDYATLVQAIQDTPVQLHLALASTKLLGPAAIRASGVEQVPWPGSVRVVSPSLSDLRALYAASRFVVLPLTDVDHDAGATVVTEAMAMGKAVIVTRTRGQVDIVRHKENGLYVPPRDPAALRSAIQYLLDNPDEAEQMGRAGRAQVEARHRLDSYVRAMTDTLSGLSDASAAGLALPPKSLTE
jgi:glycosyltransferase involved in cell wall biosynthesis